MSETSCLGLSVYDTPVLMSSVSQQQCRFQEAKGRATEVDESCLEAVMRWVATMAERDDRLLLMMLLRWGRSVCQQSDDQR